MDRSRRSLKTKPIIEESSDSEDDIPLKKLRDAKEKEIKEEQSAKHVSSSSESDIESYSQPIDKIDLSSSFFNTKKKNVMEFDMIEKEIFGGVTRLSDTSESEDLDVSEPPKATSLQESETSTSTAVTNMTFQALEDYNRKIEEAKKQVEIYNAKKSEESSLDIAHLLAAGESKKMTLENIKEADLHSSDYDTTDDEWEEVKVKEQIQTESEEKPAVPKDGIQIIIGEMPDTCKKKKGVDLLAAMKRRLNRIRKENQVYVHKVHLLCWIAHGNYVNSILNNEELLGLGLSLLPSEKCYPSDRIDIGYLEQIVNWYKKTVSLTEKSIPNQLDLVNLIKLQVNKKIVFSKKMYVLIFIIILRSLGIHCRLVMSLQVEPLHPPANELHSLSKESNDNSKQEKKLPPPNPKKESRNNKSDNSKKSDGKSKGKKSAPPNPKKPDKSNKNVYKSSQDKKSAPPNPKKESKDRKSDKINENSEDKKLAPFHSKKVCSDRKSENTNRRDDKTSKGKKSSESIPMKKSSNKNANESNKSEIKLKVNIIRKSHERNISGSSKSISKDKRKPEKSSTNSGNKSTKQLEKSEKKCSEVTKPIDSTRPEHSRSTRSSRTSIEPKETPSEKNSLIVNADRKPRSKSNSDVKSSNEDNKKIRSSSNSDVSRLKKQTQRKNVGKNEKEDTIGVPNKITKRRNIIDADVRSYLDDEDTESTSNSNVSKPKRVTKRRNMIDADEPPFPDLDDTESTSNSNVSKPKKITKRRNMIDADEPPYLDDEDTESTFNSNVNKPQKITRRRNMIGEDERPYLFDEETQSVSNFNDGMSKRITRRRSMIDADGVPYLDDADTESTSNSNTGQPKKITRRRNIVDVDKVPQLDGINDSSDDSRDNIFQTDGAGDEKKKRKSSEKPNLQKLNVATKRTSDRLKVKSAESDSESEFSVSPTKRAKKPPNLSKLKSPAAASTSKQLDVKNDIINLIKGRISEQKHIDHSKLARKSVKRNTSLQDSDSDSDYMPEDPIKKKHHDSDSDMEYFVPKPKVKKRINLKKDGTKIISSDSDLDSKKKKKGFDFWVEVFLESEEKWISADVTRGQVHCVNEIYSRATHPVSYVLAWNNDNTLKDVTRRYCKNFNTITRKLRVDQKWWEATLKPFIGKLTARDKEEDDDLNRQQLDQPLPTTISEYKNHPLYALRRHLLKFEEIYPADIIPIGYVRKEPVYPRSSVYVCKSRDIWLKDAKVVKPGEKPYKIVKARPKYDKLSNKMITDQLLEIFGPWQTTDYEPPTAENGVVPRNAFGNVELFKPCMLPKGTVHLKLSGLNKVCRKLDVDCASAIVGFDFHGGWSHPTYDGFVVCEEFADKVIAAWELEQDEIEKRENEKIEKRVYGNWKRLIRGLFIREKLKVKYNFGGESSNDPKEKKKSTKKPKIESDTESD